jgi:SnoaL-like domain
MTQEMRATSHGDGFTAPMLAVDLRGVEVRGERDRLAEASAPGIEGARAALETFYYAFNTRSLDLVRQVWADDPLIQLDTPVVGIVRGGADIAALYARGFSGPLRIQGVLEDIVAYVTPELVVFAGRERGAYTHDGEHEARSELPEIRTTCICVFRFVTTQGGWRQVYHHVALDDPDQLARFQRAVRGA